MGKCLHIYEYYSYNDTPVKDQKSGMCRCDDDCSVYGDCCFDKAKSNIQAKSSSFRNKWECRQFNENVGKKN